LERIIDDYSNPEAEFNLRRILETKKDELPNVKKLSLAEESIDDLASLQNIVI